MPEGEGTGGREVKMSDTIQHLGASSKLTSGSCQALTIGQSFFPPNKPGTCFDIMTVKWNRKQTRRHPQ